MASRRPQSGPERPFPHDVVGAKLVIGAPPLDRIGEDVPLDLARAVLGAVRLTRDNLRPHVPGAKTNFKIFYTLARLLSDPDTPPQNITKVIREITEIPARELPPDEQPLALRYLVEETRQVTRIDLIASELLESRDDVEVTPSSSELWESNGRRSIIDAFNTGREHIRKNTLLTINGGSRAGQRRFIDALIDLLPDGLKGDSDTSDDEHQTFINYALFELIEMMRTSVDERTLLYHFQRERNYLPLLIAYLEKGYAHGDGARLINERIRMPDEVEGLRLPNPTDDANANLRLSESYRMLEGQEDKRLFLYPRQLPDAMQQKLKPYHRKVQAKYLNGAVVALLDLVKELGGRTVMDSAARRNIRRLLPQGIFGPMDDSRFDETVLHVLEILDEVVLSPVSSGFDHLDGNNTFLSEMRNNTRESSPPPDAKFSAVTSVVNGPRIGASMEMVGVAVGSRRQQR